MLLQLGLGQGVRGILVATALAMVALKVDASLATPGLLLLPVAVGVITFAARPARRLQRALLAAESAVVSDTAEAISGASVLRAYDATSSTSSTWDRIDREARASERLGVAAATWSAGAAPLVELVAAVAIALVFLLAWTGRGEADLATSGAVLVALILMYRPLHGIAQAIFGWWAALASLDRLNELLDLPTQAPGARSGQRSDLGSLRMDRVSFAYGDQSVLRDASALFRRGELVALTGASGAGKSSSLALLAGLVSPSRGQISIDGAPATHEALRGASAWMPQSPALFRNTVLALCRRRAEQGALVVVATHRAQLRRHADRVLEIRDGGIVEWDRPGLAARLH